MPPKRKALSDLNSNATVESRPRDAKAAKTGPKQTASKKSDKKYRYSNEKSLEKKPEYMNLQWPNIEDFIDDPACQDRPKPGELIDEYCSRVSDLGIPISYDGARILEHFTTECDNRNQDIQDANMYTDWNGWGISEAFDNLFKDFDMVVQKKSVSPYRKWGYVEAIAVWSMDCLIDFLNNEDGEGVANRVGMLGTLILTCIDVLKEHDLFKVDGDIKNIPIVCLIILHFAVNSCVDFEAHWGRQIVRLCDDAEIKLDEHVRKQVPISKNDLKKLRKEIKKHSKLCRDSDDTNEWVPEDDVTTEGRMWYRWDWKIEYKSYKRSYPGGTHFDLTKMTKAEKKRGRHPLDPR